MTFLHHGDLVSSEPKKVRGAFTPIQVGAQWTKFNILFHKLEIKIQSFFPIPRK